MQWVCEICGYVHDDGELLEMCPVCDAPKSKFVEMETKSPDSLLDRRPDDDDEDFRKDLYSNFDE